MQLFKSASKSFSSSFSASGGTSDGGKVVVDEEGDAFADAEEAHLHPDAHEDGGLSCRDQALLERQRRAIVEVMKNLGKSLLTGNFDLLKISLPAALFEPRSYLQKLADPWVYPRLLSSAAAASDDPVLRMKWVVTYVIAGFHHVFTKWAKPFNPILGETWQAALLDGTSIFMEQISHHPPVSAFEMFGPHGSYYFHGMSQPSVSYKANAISTSAKGYRRLEFADGGVIDMSFPCYNIKGLMYTGGPRADLSGVARFEDKQNGLVGVVSFCRTDGAPAGTLLARNDALNGTIFRTKVGATHSAISSAVPPPLHRSKSSKSAGRSLLARTLTATVRRTTSSAGIDASAGGEEHEPVAHCCGNWLSHLDWDGQRFWTLSEDPGEQWTPEERPLPSDCRFRADLAALVTGDVAGAQTAKEMMENLQRADAKARKAGGCV